MVSEAHGADFNARIWFSRNRNSDSIVVYTDSDETTKYGHGNKPSEEAWKSAYYFESVDVAAHFIIKLLCGYENQLQNSINRKKKEIKNAKVRR